MLEGNKNRNVIVIPDPVKKIRVVTTVGLAPEEL